MDRLREGKISKILLARIHISMLCLDRMSLVLWFPVVLRVGKSIFFKVPSARLVAFVSTTFEALDE